MFTRHQLFDYDSTAGGGGNTVTADQPAAESTPQQTGLATVAVEAATEAPTEQVQQQADTPTPGFDKITIPDEMLGDDLSQFKGKTGTDILKAYRELRAKSTKDAQALAELKKAQKATPEHGKTADGAEAEGDEAEQSQAVTPEQWNGYLRSYFRDEAEDGADQVFAEQTGLPVELIRSVAETQRKARDAAYESVADELGDFTPVELERWLESEDSPYGPDELGGIVALSAKGNMGWVKHAVDQYKQWLSEDGNDRMDATPQKPASGAKRGTPAGAETPDIFDTPDQYQQALVDANGDAAKIAAADEKMERSMPFWQRKGLR